MDFLFNKTIEYCLIINITLGSFKPKFLTQREPNLHQKISDFFDRNTCQSYDDIYVFALSPDIFYTESTG
ncbi:MAG: hypothetical protein UZ11_BCD004000070 [Bacteroidetes bacterium OLB11]|nr:MAG: hypothetical protein UZ11_BCD004000070 [Bacteroidetes bacterium OLB11]